MLIIWIFTAVFTFGGYLFKYHIDDTEVLTTSFIISVTILLFFHLLMNYKTFFVILYTSFLLRLGMMFLDLSSRGPEIPHSGIDTENFYKTGKHISEDMNMMGEEVYGGLYSKFLGFMLNIYGDDRVFVQFLNILMTLTAILLIIRIFKMLQIPIKVQIILVMIMAYFPHSLIFSSILLRESIIALMIVLSLYYFVKWYMREGGANPLLCVTFLFIGASFHTAVIGVLIGYLFGFIFYNRDENDFKFTLKSLIPFIIFTGATTYIMIYPESISALPIYDKIDQVQRNNDNIYEAFSQGSGGSAYLNGLVVNNVYQMILYSPIKVVYFIGSPLPWGIRNFNDLIGFIFDGIFYLFVLATLIKNFSLVRKNPLYGILIIGIVVCWIIFGMGISNAGTALRHRFKLFYIIIVLLGVLWKLKSDDIKNANRSTRVE